MQKPVLVVMAAGMGSRYGGLKQIDPVGPHGEIIIDYSLFDALHAGFSRVVFIISRRIEADFREVVGERVARHMDVDYVFQELDARLPAGFAVPEGRRSSQLSSANSRRKPSIWLTRTGSRPATSCGFTPGSIVRKASITSFSSLRSRRA